MEKFEFNVFEQFIAEGQNLNIKIEADTREEAIAKLSEMIGKGELHNAEGYEYPQTREVMQTEGFFIEDISEDVYDFIPDNS